MDCQKCDGTGLLPFIKNGRVISHARIYCECHRDEPEHYYPVSPDDIDYPVSYSVYRSLCQQHGWDDPGPHELPEQPSRPFVPRPFVNVTYKVNDVDTPAFKELQDKIKKLNGRMSKYFEEKNKKPKRKAPF